MSTSKKSSVSFGPGASSLILIFVVLAMSVLGVLSLMNSRNDIRLSERSVQVTEAVYALNARAEERRAQVDALAARAQKDAPEGEEAYWEAVEAALPEDMEMEDGVLSWTETDGRRTLYCALRLLPPGGDARCQWVRHSLIAETEEAW